MSFTAQVVVDTLEFMLDDKNSERYDFDSDYIYAINAALLFTVAAFDMAFERGLVSPFILTELLNLKIYTSTAKVGLSQIDITTDVDDIWRIAGVDIKPSTEGTSPELYSYSTKNWARRVPWDVWNASVDNPFAAGYAGLPADLEQHAYTTPVTKEDALQYLFIRPALETGAKVAVMYLKRFTDVSLVTSTIPLAPTVQQFVADKAYQYMTVQMGKEAQYNYQVSENDIQQLLLMLKR